MKSIRYLSPILVITLFVGILNISSCKKNNPKSCNGKSTRREIKLCIDPSASSIDVTPIPISVEGIGNLSVSEADSDTERQDVEMKVYTITATVHKLSKHRDGDWKVKLTNGDDKYVNCESPNIGCELISTSVFLNELTNVRNWIETNKKNLEGKTVTITGVGFIDIDHKYPRNAADNEIEIHPILDIHY